MADWNDYRFFLAVARTGSLSAAARALGVDQSTVGRRLATLQDACGARLLDQTPRGYVLTPAGESVHADLAGLEHGILAVERRLAGSDARPEGIVRLATTTTLASSFLVERLAPLREKCPRLTLEIVTSNTPVDLSRRDADLALRLGAPPKQPNLLMRELGTAGFSLFATGAYVARRGRPRTKAGLRGHDVIAYAGSLANAPLGRWLASHAAEANIVLRADSIEVVREAVAAGLGIGVLPALFAATDLERLERIGDDVVATTPIMSIVHEDQARSARIRAVIDHLADIMHRERALLIGATRRPRRTGRDGNRRA